MHIKVMRWYNICYRALLISVVLLLQMGKHSRPKQFWQRPNHDSWLTGSKHLQDSSVYVVLTISAMMSTYREWCEEGKTQTANVKSVTHGLSIGEMNKGNPIWYIPTEELLWCKLQIILLVVTAVICHDTQCIKYGESSVLLLNMELHAVQCPC